MFDEDDLIPVSALSHLLFCERRVALIYIEHVWEDNIATTEGTHLHENVDREGRVESRGDVRLIRGLRLRSLRLGLSGKADMVEFHRIQNNGEKNCGVPLSGEPDCWCPFPIEYKRGKLRNEEGYIIQLCAQALCLEEMLSAPVTSGAIFFGKTRRHLNVQFDTELRKKSEDSIWRLHDLFRAANTPRARFEKKCNFCSLQNLCLPKAMKSTHDAQWYIAQAFEDSSPENSL